MDGSPTASAADLRGRRDVALDQRGRHAQHVGDVVEAGGRIVRRQQRADVDVECEQIANRRSRTRRDSGGAAPARRIELTCRQHDRARPRAPRECLTRRRGRLRRAVRRHHPGAQLAHDFLPHVGVPVDIERVERSSARPPAWSARCGSRRSTASGTPRQAPRRVDVRARESRLCVSAGTVAHREDDAARPR